MLLLVVLGGDCWLPWEGSSAQAAGIVAPDGYQKNETQIPGHFRWETTDPGGYSQLAAIIHDLGGETRTILEPLSASTLNGIDVLLIVDPGTRAKTPEPHPRRPHKLFH